MNKKSYQIMLKIVQINLKFVVVHFLHALFLNLWIELCWKIETNTTKEIKNNYDVVYCKLCVINNKRPVTSLESKNFIGSQKTTRFTDGVCDACRWAKEKIV